MSLTQRNRVTSRSSVFRESCRKAFSMSLIIPIGKRRKREGSQLNLEEACAPHEAFVQAVRVGTGFGRGIVDNAYLSRCAGPHHAVVG